MCILTEAAKVRCSQIQSTSIFDELTYAISETEYRNVVTRETR